MTTAASLSPKQRLSIIEADARVNVWHGSVSSGKTIASIIAWLDFVRTAPAGELFMVGKTLQTLERNVINVAASMFPARLAAKAIVHTNGAPTAKIFGRQVNTIGANDARAEGRIRGATAAGFYLDELTLLPDLAYWLQIMNRLRVPGARAYGTTNPDNPAHWVKKQIIDRAAELGYRQWAFNLDDNPGLDAAYIEAIKRENVGLYYDRNVLGLWKLAEGAIYDMLDVDLGGPHIVARPPRRETIEFHAVAVDYATASVFTAGLFAVTRERIVCVSEWRWDAKAKGRQLTDQQYSEHLRSWLRARKVEPAFIVVDPSASSFVRQLHTDGWPGVTLGHNEVNDGIRSVAALLAATRQTPSGRTRSRLQFVDGECTAGLDEAVGYVWDPKAAAEGEDKPIKAADHFPDMLRYLVMDYRIRQLWRPWVGADFVTAA